MDEIEGEKKYQEGIIKGFKAGKAEGKEQGKADILKELTKYSYENRLFLSASYQVEKTGKYDNEYPHFFLREKHLLKWIAEQRKEEK